MMCVVYVTEIDSPLTVPALLLAGAECTDWERDMITKSSTL